MIFSSFDYLKKILDRTPPSMDAVTEIMQVYNTKYSFQGISIKASINEAMIKIIVKTDCFMFNFNKFMLHPHFRSFQLITLNKFVKMDSSLTN